ncbi:MAG TPA: pentapeptide repeat-containing protein [Stenomitos sp.]
MEELPLPTSNVDAEIEGFASQREESSQLRDLPQASDTSAVVAEEDADLNKSSSHVWHQRASQGDPEALRHYLDQSLSALAAAVVEVELRGDRLLLSVAGPEEPSQYQVEPVLRTAIANLSFTTVQHIELYGQKEGSVFPAWRSTFAPGDLDCSHLEPPDFGSTESTDPQPSPEIQPNSSLSASQDVPTDIASTPDLESAGTEPDFNWVQGDTEHPVSLLALDSLELQIETEKHTPLTDHSIETETHTDLADESLPSAEAPTLDELDPSVPVASTSASRPTVSAAKQAMTQDFLARYAGGERAFARIDLSETDLSGANLTLVDLHEANLVWSDLQNASLYHVNLSSAKLRHANLKGAKLRSANLQGTDFLNADLTGADLSWSNLHGANLTGANLTDANLQNAIIERVIMPDGTLLD